MTMLDLPEKEHLKSNKDLVELHKRCITDYLVMKSMKLRKRKKFFIIYNHYIGPNNIGEYFFRPIKLFIYALITDRLSKIQDYRPSSYKKNIPNKKKRKCSKKN